MTPMRATILGSGTSHGVPVVGCKCSVCTSDDPRNSRTRCSAMVDVQGLRILIDTSTEFRLQALRGGIDRVDAVLYTHAHADHLHGLDDTRSLSWGGPIPLYASADTAREIRKRFEYIFTPSQKGGGKPKVDIVEIGPDSFEVKNVRIQPIPIKHGDLDIFGFRIGGFSYLTDCSAIPGPSYSLLDGTEILVIGALRYRPHATHFSVSEALEACRRIGAQRAYLTHICHDLDHGTLEQELPPNVRPAYDGLEIEL